MTVASNLAVGPHLELGNTVTPHVAILVVFKVVGEEFWWIGEVGETSLAGLVNRVVVISIHVLSVPKDEPFLPEGCVLFT